MAVIRVEKRKDYTMMANYHFKDRSLSLKAKGLMSLMLSLPENWDYTVAGLVTLCRDGRDAVQSALKELENAGYLKRERNRNGKGQMAEAIYTLLEKPVTEKPVTENPAQGNHPQLNTKELNTKLSNTNSSRSSRSSSNNIGGKNDFYDDDYSKVLKLFESEAGYLSPTVVSNLDDFQKEYGTEWVVAAIQNAARGGRDKLNIKYIHATLIGWRTDGGARPWEGNNGRRFAKAAGKNKGGNGRKSAEYEREKWRHETSGWD